MKERYTEKRKNKLSGNEKEKQTVVQETWIPKFGNCDEQLCSNRQDRFLLKDVVQQMQLFFFFFPDFSSYHILASSSKEKNYGAHKVTILTSLMDRLITLNSILRKQSILKKKKPRLMHMMIIFFHPSIFFSFYNNIINNHFIFVLRVIIQIFELNYYNVYIYILFFHRCNRI